MKNSNSAEFIASVVLVLAVNITYSQIRFEHIGTDQGLSQKSIQCIYQDQPGYLWFGTGEGLNRFDGTEFKNYKHNPADSFSISDNEIWAITRTADGILWIGTARGGLNAYDRTTDKFTHYLPDAARSTAISSRVVLSLLPDEGGSLWVGTDKGLNLLNTESGDFVRFQHDSTDEQTISHNRVRCILRDYLGVLWIGTTGGGLNRFDDSSRVFTRFSLNENDGARGAANVQAIYEDDKHDLWIGTTRGLFRYERDQDDFEKIRLDDSVYVRAITSIDSNRICIATWGNGIIILDTRTLQYEQYRHDTAIASSLSDNRILSCFRDRTGRIWIGTWGQGLNTFHAGASAIARFHQRSPSPRALSDNAILAFHELSDSSLCIGTLQGGLNILDAERSTISTVQHDPDNPASISSNSISAISSDQSGNIWIGTYGAGVNILERETGRVRRMRLDSSAQRTLARDYIFSILHDKNQNVWFATGGDGLFKLDKTLSSTGRYWTGAPTGQVLDNNIIRCLHEASNGDIWVGTDDGLFVVDALTGNSRRIADDAASRIKLPSTEIRSITEDKQGNIWIGTSLGVCRLSRSGEVVERILEADGLPSGMIYSIMIDKNGLIWITTNRGLSSFDPRSRRMSTFYASDGLQNDEYNQGAGLLLRSGHLAIGGNDGFNIVHPDSLRHSRLPILIEYLRLNHDINKITWFPGLNDTLEMKYNENTLAIKYTSLNYRNPARNRFQYMLIGNDDNWIDAGPQTLAMYTHLKPGTYEFHVRNYSMDPDNIASLSIRIIPPFWQRTWFKAMEFISAIAALIAVVRLLLLRQKRKLDEHVRLDVLRRELLRALIVFRHGGAAKSNLIRIARLFNNIPETGIADPKLYDSIQAAVLSFQRSTTGHIRRMLYKARLAREFGGKAELINSQVTLLSSRLSPYAGADSSKYIDPAIALDVFRGAKKLLDDILSLTERFTMRYKCDIVEETRSVLGQIDDLSGDADVVPEIQFQSQRERHYATITCADFSEILEELVRNAVAAMITSQTKKLTVHIYQAGEHVYVEIADTGRGIQANQWKAVFQSDFTSKREHGGFGLFNQCCPYVSA